MPGAEDFSDVLELFRDIHVYVQRTGDEVLVDDDAMRRTLGFVVHDGVRINGRWSFPLTKLRGSFIDIEDQEAAGRISNLFRTAAGRAELAGMLTQGTFPGA